jgi:hypothetical protein
VDAELADAFDSLDHPAAVTLADLAGANDGELSGWLADRKNARQVPHRLETVGYVAVRNPAAKDGLWKIGGRRKWSMPSTICRWVTNRRLSPDA